MELAHGGHLSHGHRTAKRNVSEVSNKFKSVGYHVDIKTGIIDYDGLKAIALAEKPKIITIGGSSYSRQIDYKRMREIADDTGALLHCDMAHFCGLVAGHAMDSPFPFCDVVTTTTYKSFCGPKGAMIFFQNWMKDRINRTVFPRYQAARDYSVILAMSVALLHAQSEQFQAQQLKVVQSSRILASSLQALGYSIVGGGSDSHMVLVDLKSCNIDAAEAEKALEMVGIICNQNQIPGDKNGKCTGLRLGSPPMVLRGLSPAMFETIATLVHETLQATRSIQEQILQNQSHKLEIVENATALDRFTRVGHRDDKIRQIRARVSNLVVQYPPPWQSY
jgi:glycine hydroxymethyltransferase